MGLVRQVVINRQMGTSSLADGTIILIRIPDTVLTIMIAGAMAAALIPELKSLDEGSGWRLHRNSLKWVAAGMSVLAAILAGLATPLMHQMGESLPPDYLIAAAAALPVMLLAIPINSLASVTASFLQSKESFFVPSLMALIYNTGLVTGIVLMHGEKNWAILGICATVGAACSFGLQLAMAHRFKPASVPSSGGEVHRDLVTRYGQAFMAGVMFYLLPFIAIKFASSHGEGALTSLDNAIRLTELPLGSLLTVFAVILFPTISEHFAREGGEEEALALVRRGVGLVLVFASVIAASMIFFARDWVLLLFARKGYAGAADAMVPVCIAVMSGMVFQAMVPMLQSVLNARKDTLSPFWCSLVAIVIFFITGPFFGTRYGVMGVAGAYAGAQATVFLALAVALFVKHRVNLIPSFLNFKMWVAIAVGIAACLASGWGLTRVIHSSTMHVLLSLFCGMIGLAAALAISPDLRPYVDRLVRKVRRA